MMSGAPSQKTSRKKPGRKRRESMADDKAQKLRSLAIDRAAAPREPSRSARLPSGGLWGAAAVLLIAAMGLGAWLVAPLLQDQGQQPVDHTKSTPPPVVSEPRRAGSLIASGYVVARRKATVAAEITGKIVETLVEEGMVVEAGQ